MTYLLDSNAWIVNFRHPGSRLARRIASASLHRRIVLSDLVKAELLRGAHLSNHPERELSRLRAFFTLYASHPFDEAVAEASARVSVPLRRAGTPIGSFDTAIAATALVHGCTVVTHNRQHFDRVPGLAVEDWEGKGRG